MHIHIYIYVYIYIYIYIYIFLTRAAFHVEGVRDREIDRNRVQTTYGYRSFGPGSKKEGTRVARAEAARTHSWLPS